MASALEVITELGELSDFDQDFKKAFGISGISLDLAEADQVTTNDSSMGFSCPMMVTSASEMGHYYLSMMTAAFFFLANVVMLAVGNLARGPGQVVRLVGPGVLFRTHRLRSCLSLLWFPAIVGSR